MRAGMVGERGKSMMGMLGCEGDLEGELEESRCMSAPDADFPMMDGGRGRGRETRRSTTGGEEGLRVVGPRCASA